MLCLNITCSVKLFITRTEFDFLFWQTIVLGFFLWYLYYKLLVKDCVSYLKCLLEWLILNKHEIALSNALRQSVYVLRNWESFIFILKSYFSPGGGVWSPFSPPTPSWVWVVFGDLLSKGRVRQEGESITVQWRNIANTT